MYSKRIFSNDLFNINYKDYNTVKSGNEILKAIKKEDKNTILSKFDNYNSWQTLSTSYFNNFDNNSSHISFVKNLYDSNESFINTNCEPLMNVTACSSEKNILYPYGNILSKKEITPYFPSTIYLCKWCKNNKPNKPNKINIKDINLCEKDEELISCKCLCEYSKNKRKPLFI